YDQQGAIDIGQEDHDVICKQYRWQVENHYAGFIAVFHFLDHGSDDSPRHLIGRAAGIWSAGRQYQPTDARIDKRIFQHAATFQINVNAEPGLQIEIAIQAWVT